MYRNEQGAAAGVPHPQERQQKEFAYEERAVEDDSPEQVGLIGF